MENNQQDSRVQVDIPTPTVEVKPKQVTLFINYYEDKSLDRRLELDTCLINNVYNKSINTILVFVSKEFYKKLCSPDSKNDTDIMKLIRSNKKMYVIINERPTYNEMFYATNYFPNDINIIANSDIYFDAESLKTLKAMEWPSTTGLALTRWDYVKNSAGGMVKETYEFLDRRDSQDTWMFNGAVKTIPGADFTLGMRGCDNAICHLLSESGYAMFNPSRTIRTYHLHLCQIKNYSSHEQEDLIPEPYKFLEPTDL
jgi:hypothetical protein